MLSLALVRGSLIFSCACHASLVEILVIHHPRRPYNQRPCRPSFPSFVMGRSYTIVGCDPEEGFVWQIIFGGACELLHTPL
ncbi:hypothetical protein BDV95DRAFT_271357 [Massariosphaeria phaeospora]|uniref:Secreted protein n=1 Tax=Massariosphaeria phaeospora TaxID=100035 RepID=A0A7C8HYD6_9PLEO|nr:hypothetical protein BDV95DRAFT_271357 [Massariosphaeria phaeospora]